jgi:hypothetical protein
MKNETDSPHREPAGVVPESCSCCQSYIPSSDALLEEFDARVPEDRARIENPAWFFWWPEASVLSESSATGIALESSAAAGLASRPDGKSGRWAVLGRLASKLNH